VSELDALLAELRSGLERALGADLVGIYLFGSLALGDFDPASSDVDVLVAVRAEPSDRQRDALARLHLRLAGRPYTVECSYVPLAALRRHDPHLGLHLSIGADWPLAPRRHGPEWVIERAVLRDDGVTLTGPPPATLIAPVAPDELRAAARALLLGFWRTGDGADPAWLRTRAYQSFAVLSMCRALHTIEFGRPVSKSDAARWALDALPAHRRTLVERALAWRRDPSPGDPTETVAFVREVVAGAEVGPRPA
jgi:predicted nucleotidyltransferase